jgi:hypothetical protein
VRDLGGATVTVNGTPFAYNGSAQTPGVTVVHDGDTLIENTDYTITGYSNNTDPGTASVTITAVAGGDYVGTNTANFTIDKAAGAGVTQPAVSGTPTLNSITVGAVTLQSATGQSIEYAISTANNGTGMGAWQSGTIFSALAQGTYYYVYARSVDNANYTAGAYSMSAAIATPREITLEMRSSWTIGATLDIAIDGTPTYSGIRSGSSVEYLRFNVFPGSTVTITGVGMAALWNNQSFIVYYTEVPPVPDFDGTQWWKVIFDGINDLALFVGLITNLPNEQFTVAAK